MLLFKPMVIATLYFGAIITVTGAPTAVDSHVLDSRNETYAHSQKYSPTTTLELPTVEQLVARLTPLMEADKNVFYSGPAKPGAPFQLSGEYFAMTHHLKTIWDFGDTKEIEVATDLGKLREYWTLMSQAYSMASKGKVWVVLPGAPELGMTWFQGTIWDTIEWPLLQRNEAVTQILRVNTRSRLTAAIDIKPKPSTPPRRSE